MGEYSHSVALPPRLVMVSRQHTYWAKLPAVVLLVASIWLLAMLHNNNRFFVSDVAVQGVVLMDANEIRTVAAVDGMSIFRVRAYEVARRLEDTFGCIDHVQVSCRLPGSVSISVRERKAAVIWQSGERSWWIGSDGSVLGAARVTGQLPIIRDVEGAMAEPSQYLAGVPWRLAQDMAVALPSTTTYDYVPGLGLVTYATDAKWPVYLGYEGSAENKVAIMRSLVERLASQGVEIEYIDLRNEHSPMYKKRL